MRNTSIIRKFLSILLALALVGLFASCKKDADDDSYKIVYAGISFGEDGTKADIDAFIVACGLVSDTDYTLSGTKLTFTDAGFAKFLATVTVTYQSPEPYVAFVCYKGQALMPVTQDDIDDFIAYGFIEGTDYTYAGNNQIIILTDAGYQKGEQLGI